MCAPQICGSDSRDTEAQGCGGLFSRLVRVGVEGGSVWESDFQGQETPCHLGAPYTHKKGQTPFSAHLLALTPPFLLLPGTLPSSASSVCLSSNGLWELCSYLLPVPCELCVPVFCLFPVSSVFLSSACSL